MHSMTGYGRAYVERDGRSLTVELKSVNHRFLDIGFRMPRSFLFLEDFARKQIGARLARGHVDVFVTYRNMREDSRSVTVDRPLAEAYLRALDALKQEGLSDDRSLMGVARFADVLVTVESEEDPEALRALLGEAIGRALDMLEEMREKEGARMCEDLARHTDLLEKIVDGMEARYPGTVEEYAARLRKAVEELVGAKVDETRLITEVALMADRGAIDEEISRLRSHIVQMREFLAAAEPVGRKLDFLVQELNREVNTVSSKSQDVRITQLAVDGKAEIEKLREQLQNIE